MGFPLAPWHMWGSSKRIVVPDVSAGTVFLQSGQIAKVSYKRPETWSFLFACQLLKVPTPNVGNLLVIVEYELIVGIGRTQIQLGSSTNGQNQGFCRFVWLIPGAGPPNPLQVKWTAAVPSPVLDEGAVTPIRESVDHFPAQDIQCSVKVNVTTSAGVVADTDTILVAHAYFAPRTHVRPDWFEEKFYGEETKGT